MVRTLQALTVLALISAGVVFVLCAVQWLQGASASEEFERSLGLSVVERFRQAGGGSEKSGQQTHSALALHHCGTGLVQQAKAFALYLNPPQPPKAEQAPAPKRISKQTIPAAIAAKVTPKFTLVGTSYYRSRPEESMALVSEPGSGTHWVKQGERLGHFVVEKVERRLHLSRRSRISQGKSTILSTLETILGWYRKLIAQKYDGSKHCQHPGRPRISTDIENSG